LAYSSATLDGISAARSVVSRGSSFKYVQSVGASGEKR
jgi:hypothetical protein